MKRRARTSAALATLLLLALAAAPAHALDEADRLWLVASSSAADGLHAMARRVLERFVQEFPADPRQPEAMLLLGRVRLTQGDQAAALQAFQRAQRMALPPARIQEARFWEAEILFKSGRFAEARRAYDQVVSADARSPLAPDALYGRAWSELETGQSEAAIRSLREFLGAWPRHELAPAATFALGRALVEQKRHGEAVAVLLGFRTSYPRHQVAADALYLLGVARLEAGETEAAVADLREFARSWPDHRLAPSATFTLGRTLVEQNRLAEAIPILESFRTRHPAHERAADALYLLATARLGAGEGRIALRDLKRFVALHPDHPQAAAVRGLILETSIKHGDRDDLLEAYRTLLGQSPATAENLIEAAAIARRLARERDEQEAIRRLRAEFPDHPTAVRAALDLAVAAYRRKDWKETVAEGQAAARSADEAVRVEAWLLVGEAELQLKRYKNAEEAFQQAADVRVTDESLHYRALAGLGLAHEQQREWRAALAAYESVATGSPDATLREWASRRITAVRSQLSRPDKPARDKPAPNARRSGS